MTTTSFTNSTGISLNDFEMVTRSVAVSGVDDDFAISVTLTGYSTTSPADLNLMLVAPDGETAFVFWSHVGNQVLISNFTITISDSSTVRNQSINDLLIDGLSYLPTYISYAGAPFSDFDGEITYAPFGGSGTFDSVFADVDPNGSWTLYALDDIVQDSTSLASWTLTFTYERPSASTDVDGETGGSVAEDAAIGTAVGITAKASDPDSSLTYRLTDNAGGLFAIDAQTGVVTVAKALDFETASSHTITVVATGGGADGPATEFTIDVSDVNEAPTNLVVTPPAAVPENSPIAPATLLATFSYDDDALGTEACLLSGPDADLFYAVGNGIFWADGLTPDFEDQDEYRFTLTLTDEDGLSTAAQVAVDVENRAVTNVVVAALGNIREDAVANTVAARFTAFENGTAEPQATFTLVDDAGGRFVLAGNELRLTEFGELDFETRESHMVTIRAGDGTGPAVEKSFVIQVVDIDESVPAEPTDGPDEIPGTPDPDVLDGLRGDDTFFGSDGSDTISGGDGLDRVVYAGSREDFQQDLLPDGTILVTKPDGSTDRLGGIERIDFEDGSFIFDLDAETAPFAYLLYQAAYDRVPDEAGLRFWTGILDQLADDLGPEGAALAVAAYFLDADEFEENYGTDPSDEDFVEALYDNALGRVPDGAGADFWEDQLADGLSREAALIAFATSAENLANNVPNIEDGFWVG
jgi:hypothetical protein